ncbi:MAG: hypothetical protein GOV02_01320 [Candidatus Aenigmarchaeota archaeon]|nr:hypothetical protein [Candidatus Aenigmarchaeota archaeon]
MPVFSLTNPCEKCKDNRYEFIEAQTVRCRTCFEIEHFGLDYRERAKEYFQSLDIERKLDKLSEDYALEYFF